ncbi:MAG: fibronectin type III domain-containing protein [Elusimicrobia bacterium]|nr:fibronectin type III domain-containing protein [Elusimicrobiota bacterium]
MTNAVAGGGYLYKIGGLGADGICGATEVLYAPLGSDGSAGSWTATTPLPAAGTTTVTVTCDNISQTVSNIVIGWGESTAYANGYVYVMGGSLWNFNGFSDGMTNHFSSAVYYSHANADGTLGPWQKGPDLPDADFYGSAVVYNGTLYLSGGRDAPNTPFATSNVYYSKLNADGSLSAWQTASSPMPGGLWLHGAQAAQGRLYVAGGITYAPLPDNQVTNAVFSAPIGADGDLGVWRAESSLPTGLAGHGLVLRHGVLYTVAGEEPVYPSVSVHQAGINPDGTLSPWTSAASLPVAVYLHGSAAAGEDVYSLGGTDGSTAQKAVYSLPDSSAPAAIADLSAAPLDSGSLSLSWTAPGNDGAYGSVSGGQYRLSVAQDPASLASATPIVWTASFDPGQPQSWTLDGLSAGTTYYLSLAAVDESGNVSAASNVAAAMTYYLATSTETPPVARLESDVAGLSLAAAAAPAPLPYAAVSAVYQISPAASLGFGLLTVSYPAAAASSGLALFAYDGTAWSSAAVAGQANDATADAVSGTLAQTGLVVLLDTARAAPAPAPQGESFAAFFAPRVLNAGDEGRFVAALVPGLLRARLRVQAGSVRLTAVDGAAIPPLGALTDADDGAAGPGRGDSRGARFGREVGRDGRGRSLASPDWLFRFDRAALAAVLAPGEHALTLSGTLADGSSFSATGSLTVIGAPRDLARGVASERVWSGARFWPVPACLKALEGGASASDAPFPIHGRSNERDARTVARGDVAVRVPQDAIAASVDLSISTSAADSQPDREVREVKERADGLAAVSAPIVFGPEGTQFAQPVTIQLPFDPSLLPPGTDVSKLTIRYWNPATQAWETFPSTVDLASRLVSAQTTHFSLYQVFAPAPAGAGPAAASDFGLRAGYAFPNPAHGGAVTFRIQPGPADSVSVRVYDLSGRKILDSSDFADRGAYDDGNGLGLQQTYDHVWDVSGVASGVYYYVITAKKAGNADVHKSGRVAVIK